MLDWLAILAVAAALIGATATGSGSESDTDAGASHNARQLALWIAGSVLLTALLGALLEQFFVTDRTTLFRPLLAGAMGGAVVWMLGTPVLRRSAQTHARLGRWAPAVHLLAAGACWMLLTSSPDIVTVLQRSLGTALACGLLAWAGSVARDRSLERASAVPARDFPALLWSLGIVLLALSALITLA
ncbi:MAG TPA: hypothetical protein VGE57_02415 [Solimonas sp.]